MKYLIIGGVAAGASAAARLRRLDENAEIILLERGAYISYANCGLPYHIGGVIPERENLLVMTPEKMAARFHIDVRTESTVTAIDPTAKNVTIRQNHLTYTESYDKLLIATGSSPIVMDLPGMDPEKVFQFWTIPDMDKVQAKVDGGAQTAIVVGAGAIGLEIAENFRRKGLSVTIVELAPQVLPTVDQELSSYIARELLNSGIALKLGRKVTAFENSNTYCAVWDNGEKLPADIVVMSVGVRPNSELAKAAGLTLGPRGHIVVDEHLATSHPDIYAAGDVVEAIDPITGGSSAIPLAGPANKQGRIAADNMVGGNTVYRGSFGASVIKVGSLTAAGVGMTERRLKQQNIQYYKIYTHPGSNASYYPGGAMLHMKLLFAPDGKILGAQAVGAKGAEKRIDVIATAMACHKTAPELAELELCYAPPYNSAKDPVNYLGMIAGNILAKLSDSIYVENLSPEDLLLDVREPEEFEQGSIPGAINIPLGTLRNRLSELDSSKRIVTFCRVGMRGYIGERILKQHNFHCVNLAGGMETYLAMNYRLPDTQSVAATTAPQQPQQSATPVAADKTIDVRTMACPGPIVRLKKTIDTMAPAETLKVMAAASFAPDLKNWIKNSGNALLSLTTDSDFLEALIRKGSGDNSTSPAQETAKNNDAAMIIFSNDLDKVMAGLIVACGMAAAGSKVTLFFTFWGLSALRKDPAPEVPKNTISRLFGWMLPRGLHHLKLSKMNMGGLGTKMMKGVMKKQNVPTLDELLQQARELGVQFIACEMAMDVMGLKREELIEVDSVAGVASFAAIARNAGTTLFI